MTAQTPKTWTILEVLRWTTAYLQEKSVSEPRAAAEVLLAHTLGMNRLELYLRHDQPLGPEELARFKALVIRRRQGEPVAYLTGHKEFWSLDFLVTPAVLIPRPETETLVEAMVEVAKEFGGGDQGPLAPAPFPQPPPPTPYRGLTGEVEGRAGESHSPSLPLKSELPLLLALEIGVGSGAVVVALAKEIPAVTWLALDVSGLALKVAQENSLRHGTAHRISFIHGSLLTPFKRGPWFALMVANLPYVTRAEWDNLPGEIRNYEPKEALLGGEDGLALLRPLAYQAHQYLAPGGWLALEVGPGQAPLVLEILDNAGAYARLEVVQDYHGIDRVVRGQARQTPKS